MPLLKLSSEKILEKTPTDISPEYQPHGSRSEDKARELVSKALNGEKPVFEWHIRNEGEKMIFFEVCVVALFHSGESELYASFVDITERKEKEERLLYQNKKLAEIAFLKSHLVRQPVAHILGLISSCNFNNCHDPLNNDVITKMKDATKMFDEIIHKLLTKQTRLRLTN